MAVSFIRVRGYCLLGLGFKTTFNNISIISWLLVLLGLGFKTTFNNISIISWLLVLLGLGFTVY